MNGPIGNNGEKQYQNGSNIGPGSTLTSGMKCLIFICCTGKSLSEALFLQNMGRTCCVQKLFWMSETISVHNRFELGIFMYWTWNLMNNLLSCCGLVNAKNRSFWKLITFTKYGGEGANTPSPQFRLLTVYSAKWKPDTPLINLSSSLNTKVFFFSNSW